MIQPIDGTYFVTWFFWVSTFICAVVALIWTVYDEKTGGFDDRDKREQYGIGVDGISNAKSFKCSDGQYGLGFKKSASRNRSGPNRT